MLLFPNACHLFFLGLCGGGGGPVIQTTVFLVG
jgi:hypothetical protein